MKLQILDKTTDFFSKDAPKTLKEYSEAISSIRQEIEEWNLKTTKMQDIIGKNDIKVVFKTLNKSHIKRLDTIVNALWTSVFYTKEQDVFEAIIDGSSSSTKDDVINNLLRLYRDFDFKVNLLTMLDQDKYEKYYKDGIFSIPEIKNKIFKTEFDVNKYREHYNDGINVPFEGSIGSIIRKNIYEDDKFGGLVIKLITEIDPDYKLDCDKG